MRLTGVIDYSMGNFLCIRGFCPMIKLANISETIPDVYKRQEVDYLIDDYDSLSAVPIEVKSGKDYTVHSALNTFVQNEDYHIKKAFVVSNERKVTQNGKITYIPIYYIMFFNADWGNKNLQF